MKDYYALGAFFNSIDEWGTYDSSRVSAHADVGLADARTGEIARRLSPSACELRRRNCAEVAQVAGRRPFAPGWPRRNHKPEMPGLVGHYPLDRPQQPGAAAKRGRRHKARQHVSGQQFRARPVRRCLAVHRRRSGQLSERAGRRRSFATLYRVVLAAHAGTDEDWRRLSPAGRHRYRLPRRRTVVRCGPAVLRPDPLLARQRGGDSHAGAAPGQGLGACRG